MAYSDGNSVALTPPYGFNIASPTGIQSGGYPVTLACACKGVTDETLSTLVAIASGIGSGGNNWLAVRIGAGFSGAGTTTPIEMHTQSGSGSTAVSQDSAATVAEDEWFIVVAKFTDADNWKIVIDDNALETFSTVGGAAPSGIHTFYFANRKDSDEFNGSVAWGAVWFSGLDDADMQSIAAGTTPPSDHAPDELIYFESTTAIEGENGSTVNQTGAGSIAEDGTDPAGWPPAGGGAASPLLKMMMQMNQFNGGSL